MRQQVPGDAVSIGDDPELDSFMVTYIEELDRLKESLLALARAAAAGAHGAGASVGPGTIGGRAGSEAAALGREFDALALQGGLPREWREHVPDNTTVFVASPSVSGASR